MKTTIQANGEPLVNFNSKVKPETRELTDALVKVAPRGYSVRQLLEDMLITYEASNPELFATARAFLDLQKGDTGKIYNKKV